MSRILLSAAVVSLALINSRACWAQGETAVTHDRLLHESALLEETAGWDDLEAQGLAPCEPVGECCCSSCVLGEPWQLFPERCGWIAGGWLSAGIFENEFGDRTNGPLGFNDYANGFLSHQNWLFIERTRQSECGCWDWGLRADFVHGADGPDTQAFGDEGWDFGWNTSNNNVYGAAIPQLYLELGNEDLSIKLGHFYTIIGYEVVQAPDNFFFSHSYTMYYGEPFTHTGALATYNVSDDVAFMGGWTAGWDSGWENRFDASTFLGGVALNLTEETSMTYALVAGDFGNGAPNNAGDIYMHSVVLSRQISDRLTHILQSDVGNNSGLGPGDSEWYGVNSYLLYMVNDCWSIGQRSEWFRDDDGARVSSPNGGFNGAAGSYYELTVGINYRPNANVLFRPEIRWDWFEADRNVAALPWSDLNNQDRQFAYGFDAILTY
ncbi:MAG: porin [Pirellulales bacterium]|nr:porin [Pirellulales bacterium]